jgi:hypothetical protein
MSESNPSEPAFSFATLKRFIPQRKPVEQCDLCSAPVGPDHDHLVEPDTRKINCACQACALLFSGQAGTRYKRVPREGRFLTDFQMSDQQWDGLMLPIKMAFFFFSTPAGKMVALYPSPAGPTESLLTLDTWEEIVQANPVLEKMEPDVEALLVNRVGPIREHFLAPIDECYKLVGLIRMHWRGLSGGTEVWREINSFFDELKQRARVPSPSGSGLG